MGSNDGLNESQVIQESWNRCIAWGLEHNSRPSPALGQSLGERVDHGTLTNLIAAADAEVAPYYRNVLSSSRCLILLTDAQGTVVRRWGDDAMAGHHLKAWFQNGANWREQTCGTNAIGTAITTGFAVQVQRNDHFLKLHRQLIGSAAPIYDANNELMGVLSVFTDAYLPQAHTLGMVRLLSQSVENRLICKRFEHSHCLITLNTNADNFDSPWSGILVCDDRGTVIASNQRAGQLLGRNPLNHSLDSLMTTPGKRVLQHPERTPLTLITLNKVRLSARVTHPNAADHELSVGKSARQEPRPNSRESNLPVLELGDSAVRRCADQAAKVLRRKVPLIITGETGVGKEVLVKALHQSSERRNQPLVSVNCAAIPSELVESELFGYQQGAFTGARAQGSVGLIRKADKGILFLDEIGEMPMAAQSRLLRVLQEREVTPVGSTESLPVDILLVTATNRSLQSRIELGQFRSDLFYRINGLSVALPPLRERSDKQELIQHIYREHRDPEQPETLSAPVLSALINHPWPGNIRQLVNVISVAVAIADGEPIQLWHLPEDFLSQIDQAGSHPDPVSVAKQPGSNPSAHESPAISDGLSQTLKAYRQCMGNISRTARALSISRNTVYKRLRELGVR
ncbi:sigma-54-dependent Fis family transcriptional regulator [Marinobacter salinisoli]|uniref:Sigma-54-dependent Fis family transcriptional regulator n=1 Tax=Marinobacter salinisoli TaxID=2769486 RepID=A0ABX7MMZ7_9GAMM|nr:sigma-54-dependent Fis family transcriptional regulator [Marinobacter salinisoli]QSP93549.1 sigma-54-dependent Fis family transcriptional regulator [Marinobacter salinisoli]